MRRLAPAWLGLTALLGVGCTPQPPTTGPTASAAATETLAPTTAAAAASGPSTPSSAEATAAPTASPRGETLFVREKRADCVGEGPMTCLQVRASETAEWTLLYQPIEGFTYEEGTAYELRIERKPKPNAPADGSSLRYRLVEIVSQRKVSGKP